MNFHKNNKKYSLLLISENNENLDRLKTGLKPYKHLYNTNFLSNVDKLNDFINKNHVDLLFIDDDLNQKDIFEIFYDVRLRYPALIRVFITNNYKENYLLQASESAHQVINHPIKINRLIRVIVRSIKISKLLQNEKLREIVTSLESVPILPGVYIKILHELQNPNVSLDKIGSLIEKDIALSSQILKLVNSARFAHSSRINNPRQAAVFLGVNVIRALILFVQVFFKAGTELEGFDINEIEKHSQAIAFSSRKIVEIENRKELIDSAYIAGLLHDFGKLILYNSCEEYKKVLALKKLQKCKLWNAEKAVLGTTHAEIGAYLLGLWGFPDEVIDAVAYHHEPDKSEANEFSVATAVHVSNAFYYEITLDYPMNIAMLDYLHLTSLDLNDSIPIWYKSIKSDFEKQL